MTRIDDLHGTLPRLFVAMLVAACTTSAPTVPEEALREAPPQALDEVGDVDRRIAALEVDLAGASERARLALDERDELRRQVNAIDERREASAEEEVEAVRGANEELVEATEDVVRELDEQRRVARTALAAAEDRAEEASRFADKVRRQLEWEKRRRELKLARAARAGGGDVDVAEFEAEVERSRERFEKADEAYREALEPGDSR